MCPSKLNIVTRIPAIKEIQASNPHLVICRWTSNWRFGLQVDFFLLFSESFSLHIWYTFNRRYFLQNHFSCRICYIVIKVICYLKIKYCLISKIFLNCTKSIFFQELFELIFIVLLKGTYPELHQLKTPILVLWYQNTYVICIALFPLSLILHCNKWFFFLCNL